MANYVVKLSEQAQGQLGAIGENIALGQKVKHSLSIALHARQLTNRLLSANGYEDPAAALQDMQYIYHALKGNGSPSNGSLNKAVARTKDEGKTFNVLRAELEVAMKHVTATLGKDQGKQ